MSFCTRTEFPVLLREAREACGYTQSELAEQSGFAPSAISHFERGEQLPSLLNFRELALALGASCDVLLGLEKLGIPISLNKKFQKLDRVDRRLVVQLINRLLDGEERG